MVEELVPVIEQFKALRAEIDLRIKEHTQLVVFKALGLGALVSFFAERALQPTPQSATLVFNEPVAYFIWLIPLIAVVFDMLIAGNLRAIYNIGPYIRTFIEPMFRKVAPEGMQFWEETVASAASRFFCYTTLDLFFVWSFTALPLLIIFGMRISAGFTVPDYVGCFLSSVGACTAFYFLRRSISLKRDYLEHSPYQEKKPTDPPANPTAQPDSYAAG